jgi:hypothetical protein
MFLFETVVSSGGEVTGLLWEDDMFVVRIKGGLPNGFQ